MNSHRFSKKTIFFAAPSDMAGLRDQLRAEVDRLIDETSLYDQFQTYTFKDEDNPDPSVTWQQNIGSPLDPNCAMTIVLWGERIGRPIRAISDLDPQRFADLTARRGEDGKDASIAAEWDVDVLSEDNKRIPLTGTVIEFLEAQLACERSNARLMVCVRGDPAKLEAAGADRPFGQRMHYNSLKQADGSITKDATDEYFQQVEQFARLYDRSRYLAKPWEHFDDVDRIIERVIVNVRELLLGSRPANRRLSFPGLGAIKADPEAAFLGRARLLSEVERSLAEASQPGRTTRPFALIHGPTGAGKSSFARRGVGGEALRRGDGVVVCEYDCAAFFAARRAAEASQETRAVPQPLPHLTAALASAIGDERLSDTVRAVGDALTPDIAANLFRDALLAAPAKPRQIILIVDQAELMLKRFAEAARGAKSTDLSEGWDAAIAFLDKLSRNHGDEALARPGLAPVWVLMTAPSDALRQSGGGGDRRANPELRAQVRLVRCEGQPASKAEALIWSDAMQAAIAPDRRIEAFSVRPLDKEDVRQILDHGFETAGLLKPDVHVARAIADDYEELASGSDTSVMPLLGLYLSELAEAAEQIEASRRKTARRARTAPAGEGDAEQDAVEFENLLTRPFDMRDAEYAGVRRLKDVLKDQADRALSAFVEEVFGSLEEYQERAGGGWNEALPAGGLANLPPDDVRLLLAHALRGMVALAYRTDDAEEEGGRFSRTLRSQQFGDATARLLRAFVKFRLVLETSLDQFRLVHEGLLDWWPPAKHWFAEEERLLEAAAELAVHCRLAKDRGAPLSRLLALDAAMLIAAQGETDVFLKSSQREVLYTQMQAVAPLLDPAERSQVLRCAAVVRDDALAMAVLKARGDAAIDKWLSLGASDDTDPLLMHVVRHGHLDIYRSLRTAGAPGAVCDHRGFTLVHEFAARGQASEVEAILRERSNGAAAELANRRSFGLEKTPLFVAASHASEGDPEADKKCLAVVKVLRQFGADPSVPTIFQRTALHEAARRGLSLVTKALAADASADLLAARNDKGQTALHLAVYYGHGGCVQALLAKLTAALVDAVDDDLAGEANSGRTPLWTAARAGDAKIARMLLRKGANPNFVCNGRPILHTAAWSGNADCVRALLDGGAKVEMLDRHQANALHYAARLGSIAIVDMLKDRMAKANVDLWSQDDSGLTPLHEAAARGSFAIASRLSPQRHPVIEFRDGEGRTPLAVACRRAAYERSTTGDAAKIAAKLLKQGAKVDVQDIRLRTPLHYASGASGLGELVQLLLKKNDAKALLAMRNEENATPLHEAAAFGDLANVEILLRAGADASAVSGEQRLPLHYAAWKDNTSCIRLLAAESPNAQWARDIDGRTPLHLAARGRASQATIEALLEVGSDPLQRDTKYGWHASDLAAFRGDLVTVEMLLNAIKHPAARAFAAASALRAASRGAALEVVRWLIDKKTPTDGVNDEGDAAIHLVSVGARAAPERAAAIAALLIKAGADAETANGAGWSARELATKLGAEQLIAVLGGEAAGAVERPVPQGRATSIWKAAADNDVVRLRALLKARVHLDLPDSDFNRPLHHAVLHRSLGTVAALVEQGAQVGAANVKGDTPLHVAAQLGWIEGLRSLGASKSLPPEPPVERIMHWTPLHIASWRRGVDPATLEDIRKLFLDWGWRDDQRDRTDRTALQLADLVGRPTIHVAPKRGFLDFLQLNGLFGAPREKPPAQIKAKSGQGNGKRPRT